MHASSLVEAPTCTAARAGAISGQTRGGRADLRLRRRPPLRTRAQRRPQVAGDGPHGRRHQLRAARDCGRHRGGGASGVRASVSVLDTLALRLCMHACDRCSALGRGGILLSGIQLKP